MHPVARVNGRRADRSSIGPALSQVGGMPMAYSEELAARIREVLARRKGVAEKKMFGGLSFLLQGHMCCGVVKDELVLRLGPEQGEKALKQPYTRECDFTGRPLKGMIMVSPGGYQTDHDLWQWVQQAADFVSSLPAKNKS